MMSDEDRGLLERNRPALMERIDLHGSTLLARLRSRRVISKLQEDIIKGERGDANQVGKLLDFLLKGDSNTMDHLIYSLRATSSTPGRSAVATTYLREPLIMPDPFDDTATAVDASSAKVPRLSMNDPTTEELQQALRNKLPQQLEKWKSPLEEDASGQHWGSKYIVQRISATKDEEKQLDTKTLLEQTSPGDRIIIHAEAGMGKTTLMKHIAWSWLDKNSKLAEDFKFVFIMLMRLARGRTLMDIITNDLDLVPASSKDRLQQSLDLHEDKILFLLDSYEELKHDENEGLENLITRRLFPRSRVIVTSRPGSKLKDLYLANCKVFQLHDFSKESVGEQIREGKWEKSFASQLFSDVSFLQRPINLALVRYLTSMQDGPQGQPTTQTELLNQILQQIFLAHAKKKNLHEFVPKPGSPLKNRDIPFDLKCVLKAIAKMAYGQKQNIVIRLTEDEGISPTDLLGFSLFQEGPDENSVILPHPVFGEYLAALHLAADSEALKNLFSQIKAKLETNQSRMCLEDAVRPQENVLKFLVGLSPNIADQVSSLFAIKQQRFSTPNCQPELMIFQVLTDYYQVVLGYELFLLMECHNEDTRKRLATQLVDAPLLTTAYPMFSFKQPTMSADIILPYLCHEQRVTFLKKAYNYKLQIEPDQSTVLRQNSEGGDRLFALDNYVIALVYHYDCDIQLNMLLIKGCIPVSMLSRNVTNVRELRIIDSTLHVNTPDYLSALAIIDKPASRQRPSTASNNRPLEIVKFHSVKGLNNLSQCGVVSIKPSSVTISDSFDVRLSALQIPFPGMDKLYIFNSTVVSDRTLTTVKDLQMDHCRNVDLVLLYQCEQINILRLGDCKLSPGVCFTGFTSTLKKLSLYLCDGQVDINVLFGACAHLKCLELDSCSLLLDMNLAETIPPLRSLEMLRMLYSPTKTPGREDVLTTDELERCLVRLCPSAKMDIQTTDDRAFDLVFDWACDAASDSDTE